ncbi:hypothetical protein QFZ81_006843 [Paenibacillus sp. V4I9]|uniref:hypothetical protein n=1 Tax=Paenibacillus sp. V4I9 TaxID=3042308 RepID=UPI0027849733|nr:hypothetical protein [Paenibacillus sp. V4I9]
MNENSPAKGGNAPDFEKYNKEWYRNADDIAAFLSKANPNWPMKTLQDLLYGHLQLLTNNVSARLKKDWDPILLHSIKARSILLCWPIFFQMGSLNNSLNSLSNRDKRV